jgi:hypothetical protein
MTPLSIQDQIEEFESIINQDKSKATSIYGDIGIRQRRTTKDGNISMDLLFSEYKCL